MRVGPGPGPPDGDGGRIISGRVQDPIPSRPGIKYPVRAPPHSDNKYHNVMLNTPMKEPLLTNLYHLVPVTLPKRDGLGKEAHLDNL